MRLFAPSWVFLLLSLGPAQRAWAQKGVVRAAESITEDDIRRVLFFFSGTHKDYHQPSDSPEKIDAEKEARIVRLVFYLGYEIGEASERPEWREKEGR
ncbi:MAG: hypothetical protein ACT4P7_23730 [Gemmatimonadaceae bacterium]